MDRDRKGTGKEGCAIMVSPRVWESIDGHGWIRSRIVWVMGKTGMVKCAFVCVYAPVNEKGMKGKMKLEKFWEDLGQLLNKFENVRRIFVLGDRNVRVGSTEIGGVVGKYCVEEGVNENGQYLVDVCAERGLFLSNTFQHKMIHRYTWAKGDERSLIDYIAVDSRLRREVEGVMVVRGLFIGSDHFAIVVKVRMRERWEFKGNKKNEKSDMEWNEGRKGRKRKGRVRNTHVGADVERSGRLGMEGDKNSVGQN